MISQVTIFRLFAIYIMAVVFLPIFSWNFPESVFFLRSPNFYLPMWIVAMFFAKPNVFFSKYLMPFYFLIVVLFFGIETFYSNRTVGDMIPISWGWAFRDIGGMLLAVTMYLYFIYSRDYKGIAWTTAFALFFILITSATTIIGTTLFPEAVRHLARGTVENPEIYRLYGRLGIANYAFFAGVVFLFPAIMFLTKKSKRYFNKGIITLYGIVLLYALLRSQFATALVLSFIMLVFSLFSAKGIKTTITIYVVLSLSVFYVFNDIVASFFYSLSEALDAGQTIKTRLAWVAETFKYRDLSPGEGKTYFASSRLALSLQSLNNFFMNPVIGSGWGGGHATWLDRLGLYGLLWFLPTAIIFVQQAKLNLSLFNQRYHSYYISSVISAIVFGLLTTQANSIPASLVLFFLVPGVYFLTLLNTSKKDKSGVNTHHQ